MSTILTINTKEPKVRVTFSKPFSSISGIQLVDYNFPEEHIGFKTAQTMKRGSTTLITFPPGNYSFADLITNLNHGVVGVEFHGLMGEIHLYNSVSGSGGLLFTDELKKVLNIVNRKPIGANYSLSWTRLNYQLHVNNINLGLLSCHDNNFNARPTSILASIPSSSGLFPLVSLDTCGVGVVNYLDLELLASDGAEVNFDGKQFRFSLRIFSND